MSIDRSNAQILIDHHRGRAERRIAHELNIAPATVAHVVRAAKPVEQYMSESREDLAERNGRILARYLEGATRKQVAQEFGVNTNVISKVITKAGVAQGRKRVSNPAVIERNAQIVQRYHDGATYKEIAQELGVTTDIVSNVITNAGVAQGRHPVINPAITKRNAQMVRCYKEGAMYKEIAKEFGVNESVLRNVISKSGAAKEHKRVAITQRNAQIVQRYLEGATYKEIAQEFGVNTNVISIVITKAGVTHGHKRGSIPAITNRNAQIVQRYLEGATYKEIAQEFGVNTNVISIVITKAGVAQGRKNDANPAITKRNAQMVQMYKDGAKHKEIAREFGITSALVTNVISRAGVAQGRKNDANPAITKRNAQIVHRYHDGATYKEIAQEFGVNTNVISIVITKAGVAQGRHCKSTHRIHLTPIA